MEFVLHLVPELDLLGLLNPQPQHLLVAFKGDRQGEVDRLVAHSRPSPQIFTRSSSKKHRIDRVLGPVLPFPHLPEHRVGNPARQVRRYRNPIMLLQVTPDLPHVMPRAYSNRMRSSKSSRGRSPLVTAPPSAPSESQSPAPHRIGTCACPPPLWVNTNPQVRTLKGSKSPTTAPVPSRLDASRADGQTIK